MAECVVITGTGLACALGRNPAEVFAALLAGKTGIQLLEDRTSEGLSGVLGAPAVPLEPNSVEMPPRLAGLMNKHLSLLHHATHQALAAASPDRSFMPPEEIGFFAGMGMVDYGIADLLPAVLKSRDLHGNLNYGQFYAQGYREIYPLWPLAMLNNVAFCQVAIALTIRGANAVFSPHADAAVQALAEGVASLQQENTKLVLAGGVGETLSPQSLNRARLAGILVPTVGTTKGCQPFAAQRQGTVLGEGSAMVALQWETDARARGARTLARLAGFGFSCDTMQLSTSSAADGLARAMRQALQRAQIEPAAVDLLMAHGDGTVRGDSYELDAIDQVFTGRSATLPVYASKGALGHLLAAGPALDLVLATEMIQNQIVPPCPFSFPLDSRAHFVVAADRVLPVRLNTVLINACSPEGTCAAMVVQSIS
jgi:3-oxoacyl-[acyl-carrier-protein] synthase II